MEYHASADHHKGHFNIIEFCERPYENVDHMNCDLIDRWNSVVAEDDTVIYLGDFAMGRIDETLPLADRLNGHKILIPGNHDRCWKKANWIARYEEFFEICWTPDKLGFEFNLCHFPYHGDSQFDDRFIEYRPQDDGKFIVHGHVHDAWKQNGRQINVGVDAWNGYPVHIDQIRELIANGENNIPATRIGKK